MVPDRLEQGRADAPLRDHRVETAAVLAFLRGHRGDAARGGNMAAHHGELAGIDARRAIFTRLVDA